MNHPTQTERDAIAAYATLEGAERAVAHLVSCGYDEHDVRIGPRDYEVVDAHPLRSLARRWLPAGAVAGASLVALAAIAAEVGIDTLVGSIVPMIAVGAVAGLAIGLVAAIVAFRFRRARMLFSTTDDLEPTRFEVIAERDRARARNDLARWWDPSSPSAGVVTAA